MRIKKLLAVMLTLAAVFAATAGQALAARQPQATGAQIYSQGGVSMDASNARDGYIMVKYDGGSQKVKLQITKNTTYSFDITTKGTYEIFPLTEGAGTYKVQGFEHISGTTYAPVFSQTLSVSELDEFGPFLYPNQYVNFGPQSQSTQIAAQLAAGKDQIGAVEAIYRYVIDNIIYDYEKATNGVQSGYLPNPDTTLATRTGICFDYAALMAAMLRSQDIPTKLMIGYANNVYHAWVSVYINGVGWVDNAIYFDGQRWSIMDPTFMSTGGDSARAFVGNGSNYTERYSY